MYVSAFDTDHTEEKSVFSNEQYKITRLYLFL